MMLSDLHATIRTYLDALLNHIKGPRVLEALPSETSHIPDKNQRLSLSSCFHAIKCVTACFLIFCLHTGMH